MTKGVNLDGVEVTAIDVQNGEGGDLGEQFDAYSGGPVHPAEVEGVAIVGGAGPIRLSRAVQAMREANAPDPSDNM